MDLFLPSENTRGYHRASCAKQCGLAVFCNAHTHTHTVNDYSELWKVPENGVCCERMRTPILWKQRITLPHMTFDGLYCAHHGNRFGLRCGSLPSGLGGVGGWCMCRCRLCGVNRYCGSGSDVRQVSARFAPCAAIDWHAWIPVQCFSVIITRAGGGFLHLSRNAGCLG